MGLTEDYGDGTQEPQYPNVGWETEIELCTKSVEIINRLRPRPKFVIICGDLVDAMPNVTVFIFKDSNALFCDQEIINRSLIFLSE